MVEVSVRFGAACLLLALPLAGCAANENRATSLPPVSESVAKLPEPTPAESPVATPTPPTVVMIDDPASEAVASAPQTLAEAAEAEKARRAVARKPVVVLNNASLTAYGKDQKLTVADPKASGGEEANAAQAEAPSATGGQDEQYWRDRGLEIRQRWRDAYDRIAELQREAESLRTQFYSADDPYVRDGQIKPAWDRALDELDQVRREAERSAQEVDRFLLEGRRAGALPGWLREGIELEPVVPERKSPSAEPTEPVEATEAPRDPS